MKEEKTGKTRSNRMVSYQADNHVDNSSRRALASMRAGAITWAGIGRSRLSRRGERHGSLYFGSQHHS